MFVSCFLAIPLVQVNKGGLEIFILIAYLILLDIAIKHSDKEVQNYKERIIHGCEVTDRNLSWSLFGITSFFLLVPNSDLERRQYLSILNTLQGFL